MARRMEKWRRLRQKWAAIGLVRLAKRPKDPTKESLVACLLHCSTLLRCFDPPIWTPNVSIGRKTKFIKKDNESQKIWLRRVCSTFSEPVLLLLMIIIVQHGQPMPLLEDTWKHILRRGKNWGNAKTYFVNGCDQLHLPPGFFKHPFPSSAKDLTICLRWSAEYRRIWSNLFDHSACTPVWSMVANS